GDHRARRGLVDVLLLVVEVVVLGGAFLVELLYARLEVVVGLELLVLLGFGDGFRRRLATRWLCCGEGLGLEIVLRLEVLVSLGFRGLAGCLRLEGYVGRLRRLDRLTGCPRLDGWVGHVRSVRRRL